MQSYNKFFKFASVRVFFRKKIEFILLFYARRWLWMLAYGRHLGPYFFLLAFFLPARVLSFVLLSRVLSSCSRSFFRPFISRSLFLPARVLFFFLLAFFLSSCSRSFFRPFISRFFLLAFFSFLLAFFFFLLAFFLSSFYLAFFLFFLPARVLFFFLLEFIFFNKSPSKICIYQKFVVPLHSNLNILVRD